ncbi:site-specific DNA-methyltransferase (adenine-specific) [Psychrobacillus sp. OK032]|nr:site-specific DNA-methyltransferase [Psychrobacillus sp. OK032]SER87634.1 site-specific DNA-methyltransferase (adenine-specific) [Psychrobacillus sp. OK032]
MTNTLAINEVHEGDCLTLMKRIDDGSVDMVLCDLPYGTTRNKWDSIIPLDELWAEYERIIKDNGAIVLTAQTPFDKVLGVSNLKLLKYEWVWVKQKGTGHLNAKKMPMKNHENILVFYKKPPLYNPQFTEGEPYDKGTQKVTSSNYGNQKGARYVNTDGKRYPKSAIFFNTVERGLHPTQKPTELFEYLIRTYTNEGDTVLDNCLGSGTTAIAAINTNRNFIGIEREPEYVAIAKRRIDEALALRDIG